MKAKQIGLSVLVFVLMLGLALVVVPAQARDGVGSVPASEDASAGQILVSVELGAGAVRATNLVVYNAEWAVVEQAPLLTGDFQFKNLSPGAYHVVAYNDSLDQWAAKDVELAAGQAVKVNLYPKRMAGEAPAPAVSSAQANNTGGGARAAGGSCGVSGEPTQMKIAGGFSDQPIYYVQCGRVVAKFIPDSCGCRAGGWRYINECKRGAPIYVTLPCNR